MVEQQHGGSEPAEDWLTLDALRLWYMRRVMERAGNDRGRAAKMLGIDRRTLARWLREAGELPARPAVRVPRSRPSEPPPSADRAGFRPLDALRLEYIHRVVEHTGNKTRAAEILGIDRRTLNRILARERARAKRGAAGS